MCMDKQKENEINMKHKVPPKIEIPQGTKLHNKH